MDGTETSSPSTLTEAQGAILLRLARQTIAGRLDQKEAAGGQLKALELAAPVFQEKRGVFVTLKIAGQLRGCIGNLAATETLVEGVKSNALNAAFADPRFSPLRADELERLVVEVSILTAPRVLSHAGGDDLLKKLRPHVDGVIIRQGYRAATFLPQVWGQLPDPRSFLTHLCLKAGLRPEGWQAKELEVQTYQVQYFEEK